MEKNIIHYKQKTLKEIIQNTSGAIKNLVSKNTKGEHNLDGDQVWYDQENKKNAEEKKF